ncbi:MAG: hypothetical protein ABFE01_09565 [Phycisphaerales bacterium]
MENEPNRNAGGNLPVCVTEFIRRVAKKMRYRRKVREDVQAELTAHFEDELRDMTDPAEKEQRAKRLIEEFGDAGLLAILCRRAKKRCRPLWAKVAVRSVQAVGIVVLYCLLCSLRLFIGSPSLKVDYLAWLTDRTRAGREESLNAKPYFDKAAQSVTDTELLNKVLRFSSMRPADMNESQRQILAQVAEHNAGAFESLRQGVTKPHYWMEYEKAIREPLPPAIEEPSQTMVGLSLLADPAWAFNRAVTPSVSGYRRLAQAFHASILWRAGQGDVSGALDDSLVLMDFGMHLEGRGTQAEQLVGIALEAMGTHTVLMLLDSYKAAEQDLARIQARLADLYVRHSSLMDLTGDKAVWLAMVQQTFTDNGAGNGHVLKRGLPLAAAGVKDGLTSLLLFGYPDRREMTSLIERYCSEYQLVLETPPSDPQYEARQARWRALAGESFLLSVSAPGMERMVAQAWRLQTHRRAILTTLAVMRYARDKGGYPSSLDALVGFSMIWLLADRVGHRSRLVAFLSAAVIYFGFLGADLLASGFGKDAMTIAILASLSILPILLAFAAASRLSSKSFGKVRFLVVAGAVLFVSFAVILSVVTPITDPSHSLRGRIDELAFASLTFSAVFLVALTPFLVLLWTNRFWRRRFERVTGVRAHAS